MCAGWRGILSFFNNRGVKSVNFIQSVGFTRDPSDVIYLITLALPALTLAHLLLRTKRKLR